VELPAKSRAHAEFEDDGPEDEDLEDDEFDLGEELDLGGVDDDLILDEP
jgi:hypothetical protein